MSCHVNRPSSEALQLRRQTAWSAGYVCSGLGLLWICAMADVYNRVQTWESDFSAVRGTHAIFYSINWSIKSTDQLIGLRVDMISVSKVLVVSLLLEGVFWWVVRVRRYCFSSSHCLLLFHTPSSFHPKGVVLFEFVHADFCSSSILRSFVPVG